MTQRSGGLTIMWKFLTFRLLVGGFVTGYVPYSIRSSHPEPAPILLSALTVTGVFLIAVGTSVYLRCVWDFAFGGQGDAPTFLVACGTYEFVRNPMYQPGARPARRKPALSILEAARLRRRFLV